MDSVGQELTRLEIARALERKKAPFLTAMIEELVSNGTLYRIHTTAKNGMILLPVRCALMDVTSALHDFLEAGALCVFH